jgi:hypothetical protein
MRLCASERRGVTDDHDAFAVFGHQWRVWLWATSDQYGSGSNDGGGNARGFFHHDMSARCTGQMAKGVIIAALGLAEQIICHLLLCCWQDALAQDR